MNMIMKTESKISAKEACVFLSEYAGWLLSSGCTVIRLEKNVRRIAESLGMQADLSILPHHMHITVKDDVGHDYYTAVASRKNSGISFNINTLLSRMSWDMADGKLDFDQAKAKMPEIVSQTGELNPWIVTLAVAFANASFCRLFGGDLIAMGIIFVSTFAGYMLKLVLLEKKVDMRLTVILCSFVSSVLASADGLFSLGTTPDLTIGTSVLYLVPGIPFINSFSDIIDRHYICAFGRLMDAIVITACLSFGLLCGLFMMNESLL